MTGPQGGGANHRVLTALVNGAAIEPDSPDARIAQGISRSGADSKALLFILNSLVATSAQSLAQNAVSTLVAIGDRDERSDADQLASLLPNARFVCVPVDHGSALVAPELATAIVEFLERADM